MWWNAQHNKKMKPAFNHSWNLSQREAIALQQELAGRVITRDQLEEVRYVAGVDVGFEDQNRITRAAIAVLSFPELEHCDTAIARIPTCFPYVPGLLSFRELPAVIEALKQLTIDPQLFLCDGQGIAHPRGLGIASHLGLVTGIPTIGVAKSRLCGDYREPGENRGDWTPLVYQDRQVGAVLRTRSRVKPLFISPGHRISLKTSLQFVLACTTRYRLPETTRWAHRLASGPLIP